MGRLIEEGDDDGEKRLVLRISDTPNDRVIGVGNKRARGKTYARYTRARYFNRPSRAHVISHHRSAYNILMYCNSYSRNKTNYCI